MFKGCWDSSGLVPLASCLFGAMLLFPTSGAHSAPISRVTAPQRSHLPHKWSPVAPSMASLLPESRGKWRFRFKCPDKRRQIFSCESSSWRNDNQLFQSAERGGSRGDAKDDDDLSVQRGKPSGLPQNSIQAPPLDAPAPPPSSQRRSPLPPHATARNFGRGVVQDLFKNLKSSFTIQKNTIEGGDPVFEGDETTFSISPAAAAGVAATAAGTRRPSSSKETQQTMSPTRSLEGSSRRSQIRGRLETKAVTKGAKSEAAAAANGDVGLASPAPPSGENGGGGEMMKRVLASVSRAASPSIPAILPRKGRDQSMGQQQHKRKNKEGGKDGGGVPISPPPASGIAKHQPRHRNVRLRAALAQDVLLMKHLNERYLPENYPVDFWRKTLLDWPGLSYVCELPDGEVVGYVLGRLEYTYVTRLYKMPPPPPPPSKMAARQDGAHPHWGERKGGGGGERSSPFGRDNVPDSIQYSRRVQLSEGKIMSICVRKDLRGQGLGRKMLDAVVEAFDEQVKADFVSLRVRKFTNPTAVELYQKIGFNIDAAVENYYRDGEAALIMTRNLR